MIFDLCKVVEIKKDFYICKKISFNTIGSFIMMLGMNAPKPLVKGELAKAVRKAVRDSLAAKENWKEPVSKGPWKVKFVVR